MTEPPSGPQSGTPRFDVAHPSVVARLLAAEDEIAAAGPGRLGPADCCSAEAHYRAVLPATEDRPRRAELMLCGHHARACRDRLERCGAVLFDEWGLRV